jgi:hypothetical protein
MNSALNYFSSRLAGFSRNTFSCSVAGKSSGIVAGDQVIINLPSSALIDTRSLRIAFNVGTTGANSRLPGNLEKLIQRVEILIGGQVVGSTNNSHGLLVAMKERLYGKEHLSMTQHPNIVRDVGPLSSEAIADAAVEAVVGTNSASGSAVLTTSSSPYCVELSCNFLSTCAPRYLDASLLNQIQLRLTMAPNTQCLSISATNVVGSPQIPIYSADATASFTSANAGVAATYEITNLISTVDCISFSSSEYDVLVSDQMAQAGFLSVPFKSYLSFRQSHTGSSKFQLSTRSLDRIYYGFLYTGAAQAGTATAPVLKNSTTLNSPSLVPGFATDIRQDTQVPFGLEVYRGAWETFGLPSTELTLQCSINNSFLPQAPVNASQALCLTEIAAGYKTVKDTTLLGKLTTDFVNCFSFCFDEGDSSRVASGLDCRGQQVACTLQTTGSFDIGPSWDSFIVCEQSSELRISVGRSISVVH